MACKAPRKLQDGTEVACRECKLCQRKLRNEWVGRNIAESKTSKFCYVITATYGRGRVGEVLHERAVVLTYSDVQKFKKLLARHGFESRAFITGEYGSERGRAHWNIIVYGNKPLPSFSGFDQYGRWKQHMNYERRFRWVRTDAQGKPVYLQNGEPAWWWPHGFVHVSKLSVASVNYVCKYVLKDYDGSGKQGHKGQPKDPPLGAVYFRQLAEKYADQGLAPQSPEYTFPEVRTRKGEVVRFWMKGSVLNIFLQAYIDAWARKHPERRRPPSQLVDLYEEYGRVVNDETAMLVREAFPRGESRQPMPTGGEWKVRADHAKYDRARYKFDKMIEARDDSWRRKMEKVTDVEERQRREGKRDDIVRQEFLEFQHSWDRHQYPADNLVGFVWGWGAERTEPCSCCDPAERLLGQRDAEGVRREQREVDAEPVKPDYGLGRIGRINRDYGPGPG